MIDVLHSLLLHFIEFRQIILLNGAVFFAIFSASDLKVLTINASWLKTFCFAKGIDQLKAIIKYHLAGIFVEWIEIYTWFGSVLFFIKSTVSRFTQSFIPQLYYSITINQSKERERLFNTKKFYASWLPSRGFYL